MEIIADTNRIIAALIKDGASRKIIISGKFTIYTIEFGRQEVEKYRPLILKKAKITDKEFDKIMTALMNRIIVLNENSIKEPNMEKAIQIMGKIDPDDTPFIALSLELGGKTIWTEDSHFKKQKAVKVISTAELLKKL